MKIPVLTGLIKRRILVNFRVDPVVMTKFLPAPFRPKLHGECAIAGICLIRLEQIRPAGIPAFLGISSENSAHRIAVEWDDPKTGRKEGVFIPRRDTGSRLNHLAGGSIFPGEHHLAAFAVLDEGGRIDFKMQSQDQKVRTCFRGSESDALPSTSCFNSLSASSHFFESGSLGYSVTRDPSRFDGLELKTFHWSVRPLEIEAVESSFFADPALFPIGSIEFDHALIMRDTPHEWHQAPDTKAIP